MYHRKTHKKFDAQSKQEKLCVANTPVPKAPPPSLAAGGGGCAGDETICSSEGGRPTFTPCSNPRRGPADRSDKFFRRITRKRVDAWTLKTNQTKGQAFP